MDIEKTDPDKINMSTIDEEDLEDGEIETDEENGENQVSEAPIKQAKVDVDSSSERKKSRKSSEDSSKSESKPSKNDHHHNRRPSSSGLKNSSKKTSANNPSVKKSTDDDFMGNIEKAIANALKKDGIEPRAPKISTKQIAGDGGMDEKGRSSGDGRKNKRRKRRSAEKEQSRKLLKSEDDNDKQAKYESDDLDENEMLNMRGGSPPAQGHQSSAGHSKSGQMYFDSDGSYSSYDSYDSAEHARNRHQRNRRHRDRGGRKRRSNSTHKRDKRRRMDDSDQDMPLLGSGGGGGGNMGGRNNNNNGPRKLELCKFYLMECCAKGENCLYMHSDFPCKFYYLGMKNHNRETCKFHHGKPLTDQLRNILLKHLETAPKEIIGDFPRIPRENAINLINIQHQKLLVKYGMEPDNTLLAQMNNAKMQNPSSILSNQAKIPSLLDVVTKFPLGANEPNSQMLYSSNINNKNQRKNDNKPRKSRWCEMKNTESHVSPTLRQESSTVVPERETPNVNLKTLTGVIAPEQMEKLSKMGIESLTQLTQLTVQQVIELGLSIAQIHEIQINAQKPKPQPIIQPTLPQPDENTKTADPINVTSVAEIPSGSTFSNNKDLDMRISIPLEKSESSQPVKSSNALSQDIDMRILAIPPSIPLAQQALSTDRNVQPCLTSAGIASPDPVPTIDAVKASDSPNIEYNYKNNTQYKKQHDQKTAFEPPKIDYSQYLKDANLDLNQADLDDLIDDDNAARLATKNAKPFDNDDDGDEMESSLVIEEPLEIDESFRDADEDEEENETKSSKNTNNAGDGSNNSNDSAPSQAHSKQLAELLPASYTPASIFPMSATNKIDLSSSVSQYLQTNPEPGPSESLASKEPSTYSNKDSNDAGHKSSTASFYRQDPRKNTIGSGLPASTPVEISSLSEDLNTLANTFEFFTRQVTETNHPISHALNERLSNSTDVPSAEDSSNSKLSHGSTPPARKSIYEWSDSDDDNGDNSRSYHYRSDSSGANDDSQDSRNPVNASRDRDMRISSIFLDNDYSNGDIDLRLPFKPVMANYIPATEIDGSITSHPPMAYKIHEVEVQRPDYSVLRRSIPSNENILDPRLRRILKIKDDNYETESSKSNTIRSPSYSSPNTGQLYLDTESMPRTPSTKPVSDTLTPSSVTNADNNAFRPRIDPRRPNLQMTTNTVTGNSAPSSHQQQTNRSPQLDIQNILQKSTWFQNCSSKQKIMVNQQLAIVSTELKKFHSDPSPNKNFDLQFIVRNQVLQSVLTSLGVYINEFGEFVQLSNAGPGMNTNDNIGNSNAQNGGLADLMSIPIGNNLDFMRNQQHAMQQAMNSNNPGYVGVPPPLMRFGPVGISNELMRPGLLGMAPNLPLPTPFNLFEPQQQTNPGGANTFDNFFSRNVGNDNNRSGNQNNNNNSNRNNYRSGGSRWNNNCNSGNANNRDNSNRRNQYDNRNNSRRDKK